MKLFTQNNTLIQLNSDKCFTFWCIKDPSLPDGIVNINSKFAEKLGLESGKTYKISIEATKCANLSKVIVSLLNEAEDWRFLHENYEIIQTLILDQIRLIKRGQSLPIFTDIRKTPVWIKIEEFGGYQSSDALGIISNDTELVVIDSCKDNQNMDENDIKIPPLFAVPSTDLYFSCNPFQKIPEICSYQDETFRIKKSESVPPNVLLVPDFILSEIFQMKSKEKIILSPSYKSAASYSGTFNFSVDGNTCNFDYKQHEIETIISVSNGIVVKTSKIDFNQINQIRAVDIESKNVLATFLIETNHKFVLFHGHPGSGKTKITIEAIKNLNYSANFLSSTIYIDILTSTININFSNETSTVFIIDHVDEYLQSDSEMDEKTITKYVLLYRKIADILLVCKENRVILISRTSKIFSNFSSIAALQFDHIFTLENSKSWNFKVNQEPLDSVFGLNEAKKILERCILNPLQYSDAYKANQMDVHSSVLICGPPGSGKTFLAHKFIEHHRIPCIYVRGPEILDKYVGASERGVRDLFSRARNLKPCVIFFDEIDSLVPKRGSNQSGVTDRIVNQFLTELDGTEDRSGVFIIATTSRPDLIDRAIVRPGRIDQKIILDYPNSEEVKKYLLNKGIKAKKFKSLINLISNNSNLIVSWADLVSINWNESSNPIIDLMNAISVKNNSLQKNDSKHNPTQKLTLA